MAFLSLIARLGLNSTDFSVGLKKAESAADRSARNLSSGIKRHLAAAFGTGAIIAATKHAIDHAGKVKNVAIQYGITTDRVQELDYAARQNNATLEDFLSVYDRIASSRTTALLAGPGSHGLSGAFQSIGFAFDDLQKLSPDQILNRIAETAKKAGNSQQIMGEAIKIMGTAGTKVFPAMVAGLHDTAKAAHEANVVVGFESINYLADLGDAFDQLKQQMVTGWSETLVKMLSAIGTFANAVKSTMMTVGTYWGARSGGATMSEAAAMADQTESSFAAKLVASQMDHTNKIQRRKDLAKQFAMGGTMPGVTSPNSTSAFKSASVNAWQKVGAFVRERRDPVKELEKANVALTKIVRNTENLSDLQGMSDY